MAMILHSNRRFDAKGMVSWRNTLDRHEDL